MCHSCDCTRSSAQDSNLGFLSTYTGTYISPHPTLFRLQLPREPESHSLLSLTELVATTRRATACIGTDAELGRVVEPFDLDRSPRLRFLRGYCHSEPSSILCRPRTNNIPLKRPDQCDNSDFRISQRPCHLAALQPQVAFFISTRDEYHAHSAQCMRRSTYS